MSVTWHDLRKLFGGVGPDVLAAINRMAQREYKVTSNGAGRSYLERRYSSLGSSDPYSTVQYVKSHFHSDSGERCLAYHDSNQQCWKCSICGEWVPGGAGPFYNDPVITIDNRQTEIHPELESPSSSPECMDADKIGGSTNVWHPKINGGGGYVKAVEYEQHRKAGGADKWWGDWKGVVR